MHKGDNLTPANKQESIDSSLYSCNSTAATTPSQDINMMTCNGSCDQLYIHQQQAGKDLPTKLRVLIGLPMAMVSTIPIFDTEN
jgi:hypothetical protein